jgi:hypothetical protein
MNTRSLDMLKSVALALDDMRDKFVFIGGATVQLYATDPASPESRPTLDVDCLIQITSLTQYYELEEQLRKRRFTDEGGEGAPLCRWLCEGVRVDVIPTPFNALGFSNRWFEYGIGKAVGYQLDGGLTIRILPPTYFLATKLEALKNRGLIDLRMSQDLEDVVFVLRNRQGVVDEISVADAPVRSYIVSSVEDLLAVDVLPEAIAAVLDRGEPPQTVQLIGRIMNEIRSLVSR